MKQRRTTIGMAALMDIDIPAPSSSPSNSDGRTQMSPSKSPAGEEPWTQVRKKKINTPPHPPEEGLTYSQVVRKGGPTRTKPKITKAEVFEAISRKANSSKKQRAEAVRIKAPPGITDPVQRKDILARAVDQLVNPDNIGGKIKNVRVVAPVELVIITETRAQAEEIATAGILGELGLQGTVSRPRQPRVVVTGVPSTWDAARLTKVIRDSGLTTEEGIIRPLFKRGERDLPLVQWVVETDQRTSLIKAGVLTQGWLRLRVFDFIEQPRCFKCQDFGHTAKKCRAGAATCGWCASNNHSFKSCPARERKLPPKCINCYKIKVNANHQTSDGGCTAYLRFLNKMVKVTEYGGTK